MGARLDYLSSPLTMKVVRHRIADAAGGVTDEAWANAVRHYDDDQLVALVAVIALINAYNRMNVAVRQPAGDYQPGQFG